MSTLSVMVSVLVVFGGCFLVANAAPDGLIIHYNDCERCGKTNVTTTVTIHSRTRPAGYMDYGIGVYKHHRDPVNFGMAWKVCEAEGAHLVVIDSEEEADLLVTIMNKYPATAMKPPNSDAIYVGLHDFFIEGQFTTVQGRTMESAGYLNWGTNEPNGGIKENCVFRHRLGWYYDVPCTSTASYICELN